MRLIDADRLLSERMKSKYYHLPNGDVAIPIIDIENAPTVNPEHDWIPVTERLPKKSVEVLTCDSVGTIEVRSLEASYDGMLYWESQEGECERLSGAIAWMPLPESYNGVTE